MEEVAKRGAAPGPGASCTLVGAGLLECASKASAHTPCYRGAGEEGCMRGAGMEPFHVYQSITTLLPTAGPACLQQQPKCGEQQAARRRGAAQPLGHRF